MKRRRHQKEKRENRQWKSKEEKLLPTHLYRASEEERNTIICHSAKNNRLLLHLTTKSPTSHGTATSVHLQSIVIEKKKKSTVAAKSRRRHREAPREEAKIDKWRRRRNHHRHERSHVSEKKPAINRKWRRKMAKKIIAYLHEERNQ